MNNAMEYTLGCNVLPEPPTVVCCHLAIVADQALVSGDPPAIGEDALSANDHAPRPQWLKQREEIQTESKRTHLSVREDGLAVGVHGPTVGRNHAFIAGDHARVGRAPPAVGGASTGIGTDPSPIRLECLRVARSDLRIAIDMSHDVVEAMLLPPKR